MYFSSIGEKFGRVHPYYYQFFGKFFFQLAQIGYNMLAIDATKCPEIQQYYFASKVCDSPGFVDIEPTIGRINFRGRVYSFGFIVSIIGLLAGGLPLATQKKQGRDAQQ